MLRSTVFKSLMLPFESKTAIEGAPSIISTAASIHTYSAVHYFHICFCGPTWYFHFCQMRKHHHRIQEVFVSSLFPFSFFSLLLRHPATNTQTYTYQWLCILHEFSTSEGLFGFFSFCSFGAEMMRWKPDPALKGCFLTAKTRNCYIMKHLWLEDFSCCSL